ncbi:uncharacterized protein LOC126473703 [Schistocerca serialis cubense]|uniref:uncharacterized protein LOC126473703 n=1 Tax=Schistocerca serialis cubense TaxID=2023355 RepID=UPI00214E8F0B|nr:uncharacterized protein LOC126473703 [Schistocerca serialis cubense]
MPSGRWSMKPSDPGFGDWPRSILDQPESECSGDENGRVGEGAPAVPRDGPPLCAVSFRLTSPDPGAPPQNKARNPIGAPLAAVSRFRRQGNVLTALDNRRSAGFARFAASRGQLSAASGADHSAAAAVAAPGHRMAAAARRVPAARAPAASLLSARRPAATSDSRQPLRDAQNTAAAAAARSAALEEDDAVGVGVVAGVNDDVVFPPPPPPEPGAEGDADEG